MNKIYSVFFFISCFLSLDLSSSSSSCHSKVNNQRLEYCSGILLYAHLFILDVTKYLKRSIDIYEYTSCILSSITMVSFSWTTIELAAICFGIILIILLTVGGNLVVLFAFYDDPHLLTPSNNFLLSMAIADLLVGLIAMPFYS